jgi:hypothetical protein
VSTSVIKESSILSGNIGIRPVAGLPRPRFFLVLLGFLVLPILVRLSIFGIAKIQRLERFRRSYRPTAKGEESITL